MDDTEVIAPAGQSVVLGDGGAVRVEPLRVGQLPAFLRAIRPIMEAVRSQDVNDPEEIDLMPVFMEAPDAFIDAIGVATGLDRDTLDALGMDDLVALARAVIEVNTDFFVRRVAPLLKEEAASGATPPPGPPSASG